LTELARGARDRLAGFDSVTHLSAEQLEAGLAHVRESPAEAGVLRLITLRPAVGERVQPDAAALALAEGLVGDNWLARGSRSTPSGEADPERQVTVMNHRLAVLVAGSPDRVALAGDQLYVDLDLSVDNLPTGALLQVGTAVLGVSEAPHLGCATFVERFGGEAMRFVNGRVGRQLRLRGLNAAVVVPGVVRVGDVVTKAADQR